MSHANGTRAARWVWSVWIAMMAAGLGLASATRAAPAATGASPERATAWPARLREEGAGMDGTHGPATSMAQAEPELLRNGGFEEGLTGWSAASYHLEPALDDGTEEIVTDGCLAGRCLRLTKGRSTWQGASQPLGALQPGATYVLRAHFRTETTHYGFTNLRSGTWRGPECTVVGRSHTRQKPGTGDWTEIVQVIRSPEEDECGPSDGTGWSVYLYSYAPEDDPSPVYYDEVSLVEVADWETADLEDDRELGIVRCLMYRDGYPMVPCAEGTAVGAGQASAPAGHLQLRGVRDRQELLEVDVPVRPRTAYRLSVSLAVEDRVTFSYLDLAYPSSLTRQRPGLRDPVDLTKGIWSGLYDVTVDGASVLPPIIKDAEYRSPSSLDWYREDAVFETGPGQFVSRIIVSLTGFEGRLLVDGLTVEEASGLVDDAVMEMAVPEGHQGMRIVEVAEAPPAVQTNAGRYELGTEVVRCLKDGRLLAEIGFGRPLLDDLSVRRLPGNVVMENDNVLLSVGADSVLLAKPKTAVEITVSGLRRDYHLLEAGVLFAAGPADGFLFAPIRPPASVRNMPHHTDPRSLVTDYLDEDFARLGQQVWRQSGEPGGERWEVTYALQAGSGFAAQVFPPKEFSEEAYCTHRMHTIGTDTVRSPDADFRYNLQLAGARIDTGLVWMSGYAQSANDLDPPDEYCLNAEREPVSCGSGSVASRRPVGIRFDVTGPYSVAEPEAFQRLVDQAHERGMRVIVYMSPQFYYTSDVDRFLADLRAMVDEFGVDGVYYDGLYSGRPLESLELVRKTRMLLGDRYYAQHSSWVNTLVRRTHRYRVPFLDAQADVLWLGEGVKAADEDTWRYNFCGRDVSNTASMLLAELRPVDWTADRETSVAMSMPAEEQVRRTLACGGLFRTNPYSGVSSIHDSHFQVSIPFDSSTFVEPYNAYCREHTCGNGACDVGESLLDCAEDCAPERPSVTQTHRGEAHHCDTDLPVAQWLLDGRPLHLLHYTFEQDVAGDSSGFEHHPDGSFGISRTPPGAGAVEGRKAHAFDGTAYLYGETTSALDRTDHPVSVFATIQVEASASSGRRTILSFGPDPNLWMGLVDGRPTVEVLDAEKAHGTEEIMEEDCHLGRCALARHNDATWQAVSQAVTGLQPGFRHRLGAMFRTTAGHDGYVNLYDRDWRDASCRRTGRSFSARARGDGTWRPIEVVADIPETDDCGQTTRDDAWSVYLYTHSPVADNSPIGYDEAWLVLDQQPHDNLLANPGFEDGFEGWAHSSYIARDVFASTTVVADGTWRSVGLSYDPPRLALYVDGRRETTGAIRLAAFDRPGTWVIGSGNSAGSSDNFVGLIDDLIVSAAALTEQQAERHASDQLHSLPYDGEAVCVFQDGAATYSARRCALAWLPALTR